MTIDARSASPEPSLHTATLLSRTRLTQLECAARLGISERTLRYHLTGRPMSYALRCLFERLARECEFIQLAATVNREPLRDYQEKILGWLQNQFLGRVNREGRVTEQTVMHGVDIYRRTSDGYEWVDCESSHPESVAFHFVRTGEKRTMRKVKRDGTA